MSTLDRLETRSRRSLRCVAKRRQCRRKCSLSSIPVRHRHDGLEHLKMCLNRGVGSNLEVVRTQQTKIQLGVWGTV